MIASLTISLTPTYRLGGSGRRYLTRRGAYRAAAWAAWRRRYLQDYPLTDDAPYHTTLDGEQRVRRVVDRLARWLEWRDGRVAALAALGPAPW